MTGQLLGRRGAMIAGALAAGLPRYARAQKADTIGIGVLTDQAGPYAASGGPGSVLAANMAVKDFGGTVLGKKIEILSADTFNKPDVATSVARQWYDSGVDAITDLPVTPIAAAVQQVAREKGRSVMIAARWSTASPPSSVRPSAPTGWTMPTRWSTPRPRRLSPAAARHGISSRSIIRSDAGCRPRQPG